ncbi:hypothetical protein RUM43_013564 [Polyplax serrata]|uniref:Uncharacterized protein n=1 Tax=Polyplax serrata TaxID=468196 RepID=A0AAN8PJ97_POLSC
MEKARPHFIEDDMGGGERQVLMTVSLDEAKSFVSSQDENCSFVETSAKRNVRIDDLFHELFLVSGMPLEMAPNHHKRINAQFGSPCTLPPSMPSPKSKKCTISIKRRLSDACGVVAPNVRRPSIRTDLMIMRTKTAHYLGGGGSGGSSKSSREGLPTGNQNKCVVQ